MPTYRAADTSTHTKSHQANVRMLTGQSSKERECFRFQLSTRCKLLPARLDVALEFSRPQRSNCARYAALAWRDDDCAALAGQAQHLPGRADIRSSRAESDWKNQTPISSDRSYCRAPPLLCLADNQPNKLQPPTRQLLKFLKFRGQVTLTYASLASYELSGAIVKPRRRFGQSDRTQKAKVRTERRML